MLDGVTFLSDEWLASATELSTGQQVIPSGSFRVAFEHEGPDATVLAHQQVWEHGKLATWRRARGTADTQVSCGYGDFAGWLHDGPASQRSMTVTDPTGRTWCLPPSPGDLAGTSSREVIEGLDFTARIRFAGAPLRDPTYVWRDGVLTTPSPALEVDPDIVVDLPLGGGVGYLFGQVPFRHIAAESAVRSGGVFALACLTGLLAPVHAVDAGGDRRPLTRAVAALDALVKLRRVLHPLLCRTEFVEL